MESKGNRCAACRRLGLQFGLILWTALHVLGGASAARANDVYVAQSTAGGASGAACADARAVGSLNAGDWAPGNTIHLCGTITSTLKAQGNGSNGAPVTVVFEAGASISVPACGANGCIDLQGNYYVVIDGSPTASPCGYVNGVDVPCSGTIVATASGTGLGSSESIGINAMGASHIEVRNLNIANMYVHSGSGNDVAPGSYYAIHVDGSNIFIHNCVMHDANGDIVGEAGTNNSEFSNNQMYNSNWNVFLSGPSSNTPNSITQVKIRDNDMHDYANWDTSSDRYHHDGAIIAGNNNLANGVSYVSIYNNYIHGSISNCSQNCATAYIFVNDANHVYSFNNVLVAPANQFTYNGLIFYWSPGTLQSNSLIASNTVIGGGMSAGACVSVEGDASMTFENNIISNCKVLVDTYSSPSTKFSSMANNVYQDASLSGVFQISGDYFSTLTTWLSSLGGIASQAITTSLNLAANLAPLPNSVAVGAGANLSSLGIAALDYDKAGLPRPASGSWDAGAFQSGTNAQRPAPPTGLTVSVQ
jgi:hypothetical protein